MNGSLRQRTEGSSRTGLGWGAGVTVAIVAMVIVAPGCENGTSWDDPGPEATFRNFLMHWFKNERDQAFEMIDPEDREQLVEPLETLRERLEASALPTRNEMLVAGRVDNPYDIRSIEVEPKLEQKPGIGEHVTLQLAYQDGRSGSAKMVWRGEAWFVDLPLAQEAGEKAVDPGAPDTGAGRDGAERTQEAGNRGTPDAMSEETRD